MPRYLFVLFLSLLPVFSVQAQETIHEGDLYLNEGETLNLAGDTLIITGNFYQEGGTVNINGGSLIVEGDYLIQNLSEDCPENIGCHYSDAYLIMKNPDDKVSVGGNFIMQSRFSHEDSLTAGVMELYGNFSQLSPEIHDWSHEYHTHDNFHPTQDHKVLLVGDSPKTIHFDAPEDSHFNIPEFDAGSSGDIEINE